MTGNSYGIFLLCLLQHALSVPMSDFFMLGTGTFTTLGDTRDSECAEGSDSITSEYCDNTFDTICVSFSIAS